MVLLCDFAGQVRHSSPSDLGGVTDRAQFARTIRIAVNGKGAKSEDLAPP